MLGIGLASIRPDDDPLSLIVQTEVQEAIARLRSMVSQLISDREEGVTQGQSSTRPSTLRLDEEAGGHRHDAGREEILQDGQNVVYSVGEQEAGRLAEPRDSRPDTTLDDTTPNTRPSLMMRKFMAADADAEEAQADWDRRAAASLRAEEENRQRKEWYFFYGSLMDPKQLQRVLGLKETPRNLQPAKIIGYHIRMRVPYPVLLDGPPGNVVKGIGYEIEGGKNKDKLAAYETAVYREHKCLIQFGEESVIGTTFKWAGDVGELKEGSFDLKDWQMARLLED